MAERLFRRLDKVASGPDQSCALIASSDATTESEAGVFTTALAAVLAEGPERGWWSTTERFLFVEDLIRRLDDRLSEDEPAAGGAVPKLGGRRLAGRVFPNPRYRPQSLAVPLDEAHFLPKARGVEAGQLGWFFTGRTSVLRRIVSWLERPGRGLFVVTGPAGVGKSAVVGRVITLSVPEYRQRAAGAGVLAAAAPGTIPPEGLRVVVFHARHKRVDELLDHLGDALGAGPLRKVSELAEHLAQLPGPTLVAVDALDEAAQGHARRLVDEVVVPLSRLEGVKVLLGTRPGVCRWSEVGTGEDQVVDLVHEPRTLEDIAAYSADRLLHLAGSGYAGRPELAREVGAVVASRALSDPLPDGRRVGSFLVARLLTKLLATRPAVTLDTDWQHRLPSGFAEAFEADLAAYRDRLGAGAERTIRALLEGLAWDEGSGVPRRLLPAMTLAVTGQAYEDDDVAMLLREAAGHLLEAEVDGWAVYRLYHERLREHLRDTTRSRHEVDATVHARIADLLIDFGAARRWQDIDPYLAATLPRHARPGGRIERLVVAPGFLENALPSATLRSLPISAAGNVGAVVRAYRRASHGLGGRLPDERRFALSLSAARSGETVAEGPPGPLRVRWLQGQRDAALQTLAGHAEWVESVALGSTEGRDVVVSASWDGSLLAWDLASAEVMGEPFAGHVGGVSAVALASMGGRLLAVSGGWDGTLRVWDVAAGQPSGGPIAGHGGGVTSLAVASVGGRLTAISGSWDGTVRAWDLETRHPVCGPMTGHRGPVEGVALVELDGGVAGLSAGRDGTVRTWDPATGTASGEPFTGHAGWVRAVAGGTVGQHAVAISGGDDGTVRMWDLATHQPLPAPIAALDGWVMAVAVGHVDGRPTVVAGGSDGAVRAWDALTRDPLGVPMTGHTASVTGLALGSLDGRAVAVSSGGDGTVRVWDLASADDVDPPPDGHAGAVETVAVGHAGGKAVALSGGHDGTVRVWDLRSGAPVGPPLAGHVDWVMSVGVAAVEGRARALSGGRDGTLRLWDLEAWTPIGSPMRGHRPEGAAHAVLGSVEDRVVAVSGGDDGTLRLWDLVAQRPEGAPLNAHVGWVQSVTLGMLAGRLVAVSGGWDGTVGVWDFVDRIGVGPPLDAGAGPVMKVATGTVGGRDVALAGHLDGTIRVWDLAHGVQAGDPLVGQQGRVRALAQCSFADRAAAVSGGDDGALRIWDLTDGSCRMTLPLFDPVMSLAVFDGGLVAAAGPRLLCLEVDGLRRSQRSETV
ncbi:MAG: hypothetical protein ACRD1D_01245 [Acidimicrobiales bacterium]